MYVGHDKVREEEFHAYGTDSLCDDQTKLDVIPRDHRAVDGHAPTRSPVNGYEGKNKH